MSDTKEDLIRELRANGRETVNFFTSLEPDQLATEVYTDGPQWTARQVFAHLITIEASMQRLFQNILEGGPGSPEDFDVERYVRDSLLMPIIGGSTAIQHNNIYKAMRRSYPDA